MTLDAALREAAGRLSGASATPRLDAELLLAQLLGKPRSWLYAWGDRALEPAIGAAFEALIERRRAGEPVAYLIGYREFHGLELEVGPATLIPRPDTECLVDLALSLAEQERGDALDLGTGSGAIALAFARARPGWRVVACDRVEEALALARRNAERLSIDNLEFVLSDWFAAPGLASRRFGLILSNPPYIAEDDHHLALGDLRFEPRSALVAADGGLADLRRIIMDAFHHLLPGGWLLLEHGMAQGGAVRDSLMAAGFERVATHPDLGGRERVSLGRRACLAPGE